MSVPALLMEVHGHSLRTLCAGLGAHFGGLSVAARAATRQGLINVRMRKKLEQLDTAFAIARHVSDEGNRVFVESLRCMIDEAKLTVVDTDELVPTSGTTGDSPTEATPEVYPSGHTYGEDRAELAQKAYRCRMKRIQLRSEDVGPVSGGDCHPHKSEDPFDEDWKEMALKAYRCRMKRLHVRDPGYSWECPQPDLQLHHSHSPSQGRSGVRVCAIPSARSTGSRLEEVCNA